jgi:hypothetical protein
VAVAARAGLPERLAGELQRWAGLPDDLVHDLADALGAVEDREVVDVAEGLGRRPHDLRQLLGELLPDDRVGLLLERLGALGDRLRLGQAAGPDGAALRVALGLRRSRLGQADLLDLLGLRGRGELDALGVRRRGQLDLARVRLGRELGLALARLGERDPRLALTLGLDPLAVGLGVGRLADRRLQPLLLALGLESATSVSWTTTCLRASASASGPACALVAVARSCSAWNCASLICVSRWAAAFSASASCSRSVASRSAAACAIRAIFLTSAARGSPSARM